jgi:hypothetical protein
MLQAASMTCFDHFANELTERELLLEAEQAARAEAESAKQLLAARNELDRLKDELVSPRRASQP